MLVGPREGVGELEPKRAEFGVQGRDLLVEPADLALLKREVGLDHRSGGGAYLKRQTWLLVHEPILPLTRPAVHPV